MVKDTYAYLLQQYGLASAWNTGSLTGTSSANGNTYNIALSPLFFVRGGYISPITTNKFNNAGQSGFGWSSRASSDTGNAYSLNFGGGVLPSDYSLRHRGFSLRCLISTP